MKVSTFWPVVAWISPRINRFVSKKKWKVSEKRSSPRKTWETEKNVSGKGFQCLHLLSRSRACVRDQRVGFVWKFVRSSDWKRDQCSMSFFILTATKRLSVRVFPFRHLSKPTYQTRKKLRRECDVKK